MHGTIWILLCMQTAFSQGQVILYPDPVFPPSEERPFENDPMLFVPPEDELPVINEHVICSTHGLADGCSVPLGMAMFFKSTFKPACNKHDICYSCGGVYGYERGQCDQLFHADMKNICDIHFSRDKLKQVLCKGMSDIYYTGVKALGQSKYEFRSPFWCFNEWAFLCLSGY